MPTVSVLMSVFNQAAFLLDAVASILEQTYRDFEFIIINDASTDSSPEQLEQMRLQDTRIRLFHNAQNLGLTRSLNLGLEFVQGIYIARMDADDIALAERLEKQVAFMDRHTEIGVCGTWVQTMGETSRSVWQYPTDDQSIRCHLLFESALAHPSVMLRRSLLKSVALTYDPTFRYAQDYEFWTRLSQKTQLANIPEVLIYYRVHSEQVGKTQSAGQRDCTIRIHKMQFIQLGIEATEHDLALHEAIGTWQLQANKTFVCQVERWLNKLRRANQKTHVYQEPTFSKFLGERWFLVCRAACPLGWWTWFTFWRSPLSWQALPGRKALIKFWHDTTRL